MKENFTEPHLRMMWICMFSYRANQAFFSAFWITHRYFRRLLWRPVQRIACQMLRSIHRPINKMSSLLWALAANQTRTMSRIVWTSPLKRRMGLRILLGAEMYICLVFLLAKSSFKIRVFLCISTCVFKFFWKSIYICVYISLCPRKEKRQLMSTNYLTENIEFNSWYVYM